MKQYSKIQDYKTNKQVMDTVKDSSSTPSEETLIILMITEFYKNNRKIEKINNIFNNDLQDMTKVK